jgi:hypothetical protein
MSVVILGIDLGKNSCSVVGPDPFGEGRSCVIGMEACCGAHHLGAGDMPSRCSNSKFTETRNDGGPRIMLHEDDCLIPGLID